MGLVGPEADGQAAPGTGRGGARAALPRATGPAGPGTGPPGRRGQSRAAYLSGPALSHNSRFWRAGRPARRLGLAVPGRRLRWLSAPLSELVASLPSRMEVEEAARA